MRTKIFLLILFLSTSITVFGIGNGNETPDDQNNVKKKGQIGLYSGYAFTPNISNAHGDHGTFLNSIFTSFFRGEQGTFGTQSFDASVEGIDIEQSWTAGIYTRYYFKNNFGLGVDVLYSKAKFPEQDVILQGYTISQPKSDLDFYTISVGPIIQYNSDGIWQLLNPYASAALSILLGNASDVNLSPYGKGGNSSISGIGFNLHLGTQYYLSSFIISLEYRFEYLDLEVDHFRSFINGLNLIKSGSYILLGGTYSF